MKNILIILIVSVLSALLAYIYYTLSIGNANNNNSPVLATNSGLEIYALTSDMRVYIDNVDKGIVRLQEKKLEIPGITPGKHDIRIENIKPTNYFKFSKSINFISNVNTVINIELGPNDTTSQWWILEPSIKLVNSENSTLDIYSDTVGDIKQLSYAKDGAMLEPMLENRYLISNKDTVNVKVFKPRFTDMNIKLFGADEAKKEIFKYNYILKLKLFENPINIE